LIEESELKSLLSRVTICIELHAISTIQQPPTNGRENQNTPELPAKELLHSEELNESKERIVIIRDHDEPKHAFVFWKFTIYIGLYQ
jgi:hypothetical protein